MTKQDKVAKVMHEWKAGTLTSNGKQVTDYDQAVAIALSEAGLSKFARGGWVLYDEDDERLIKVYETESEARKNLYEYEGNANIVEKSSWDNNQYADGGEFEDADDFIENVKEMHESIDYVVLKDGTKVNGYDLMEKGGDMNKYAKGGGIGNDNFYVKSNFGNWAVTDRRNNKMVVGYSKKEDAIITAKGLNYIDNSEELNETISKLKTMKGYGHFLNQYAEGGGIEEEVPLRADIDGDIYEVIGVNHKLNKVRAKDFSSGDVIEMPIDNWYKESFEFGTQAKFKANGREYVGMVTMKDGQKSISLFNDENYSGDAERVIPFNKIDLKTLKPTMEREKFAVGGEIGNQVTFSRYGERTTGRVTDKLRNGYEVVTDEGTILVEPQEVISFSDEPIAKKKRFGFFEGGGEIQSKIEKLKKVVSSKMINETARERARILLAELEKELHESKETKAEEKAEHKAGDLTQKEEKRLNELQAKEDNDNLNKTENSEYEKLVVKYRKAEENKMTGESEGERNVGMDEEKDYVEAKTKALEKSLKDKTISETQRKRDEKELALFKGAEAKKPTTRKAPVKKAVVKKVEVKKEVETPAKPKADHKKLVAKLKAKKGDKEYDNRASLVPFTDKRRERSESSDKKRSALPPGKRVSENGVTYYERRLNRTDLSKKDKFAEGGEVKGSDWGLNLNW